MVHFRTFSWLWFAIKLPEYQKFHPYSYLLISSSLLTFPGGLIDSKHGTYLWVRTMYCLNVFFLFFLPSLPCFLPPSLFLSASFLPCFSLFCKLLWISLHRERKVLVNDWKWHFENDCKWKTLSNGCKNMLYNFWKKVSKTFNICDYTSVHIQISFPENWCF